MFNMFNTFNTYMIFSMKHTSIHINIFFYYLFFTIIFYVSSISLYFSVFVMCAIFIFITAPFWTEIFDVILQMNISRSRTMPIMTEYFIDQEKYFYFILLYTNVTICVQTIITLAIGTTFITFFQHIYGMFKIARYKNKNKTKAGKNH